MKFKIKYILTQSTIFNLLLLFNFKCFNKRFRTYQIILAHMRFHI
jgi:hypothetical protein